MTQEQEQEQGPRTRIVALEEHVVFPVLLDAWSRLPEAERGPVVGLGDDEVSRRLRDVGPERLAAMDDQGVDVQVLSLNTPGVQNLSPGDALPVAREANDALAEVVRGTPSRFEGVATLPTPDPSAAAAELERAVTSLGLVGAMLNGRTGTTNADAPQYDDLYGVAEALHAPLLLHPQAPVAPVREAYYSGYGDRLGFAFAGPGIGWHYETGVQLLRMVFSGVFDRHPDLQVVLGHWGEVVLFFVERTASMMASSGLQLQRPLEEVVRENLWVTGSGILSERYLRWSAEVVGTERILSATDYPFVDNSGGRARAFLEGAPVDDAARAAIGSGNWERLTASVRATTS